MSKLSHLRNFYNGRSKVGQICLQISFCWPESIVCPKPWRLQHLNICPTQDKDSRNQKALWTRAEPFSYAILWCRNDSEWYYEVKWSILIRFQLQALRILVTKSSRRSNRSAWQTLDGPISTTRSSNVHHPTAICNVGCSHHRTTTVSIQKCWVSVVICCNDIQQSKKSEMSLRSK